MYFSLFGFLEWCLCKGWFWETNLSSVVEPNPAHSKPYYGYSAQALKLKHGPDYEQKMGLQQIIR